MSNRTRTLLGIGALGLAFGSGYGIRAAASGIPTSHALTYVGELDNPSGPITGTHNIQVLLYDAATGGNTLCQSAGASVNVANGRFSVQLPDSCTNAVAANPNAWVDVLVDGSDMGRTAIGAVPYAVEANHAVSADNAMNATSAARAADGGLSAGLQVFTVSSATAFPCALYHSDTAECTCPAGTWVVSGGGYAPVGTTAFLRESRPISTTAWRVSCATATTDVPCAEYNLVCARIGP
jgi:hypothetical protein